jgi:hypothetical protein
VPDETSVLLELERLRGAVEVGFARIDGRLDGSQQRTEGVEKDVSSLEGEVSVLRERLGAVERKIWMAAGAAAVLGAGGSAGVWQLLQ